MLGPAVIMHGLIDLAENPGLGMPMTILNEKTSHWPRPCCAITYWNLVPISACQRGSRSMR